MCVCDLYAIPVICVYLPHKEPSLREEILYGISSMWNLKRNNTNEFTYKTQRLRDFDIKLMVVQKDEKGYQGGLGEN